MHLAHPNALSMVFFIAAVVNCLNDPAYYEVENSEKKIEFDDNPTKLPEAESYVIGVKRALLPFRQLSKYLRRPANDPRTTTFAGIHWKPPQQDEPEMDEKTQTQKTWDNVESDLLDRDSNYPEIILIRPVNASKVDHKEADDAKTEGRHVACFKGSKTQHARTPQPLMSAKKLKYDNHIFQGNGINIKLTFSVDVANQSKAEGNSLPTTFKPLKKNCDSPCHP